jgi:hypothetical protein
MRLRSSSVPGDERITSRSIVGLRDSGSGRSLHTGFSIPRRGPLGQAPLPLWPRLPRYIAHVLNPAVREPNAEFDPPIATFPVTFCTKYVSTQHPSLREMEEMAWVLRTDTKKNSIGFVRASDLVPKHRFVLEEDDC